MYIIKACLAASRTHLAKHIQDNPILERAVPNNQVSNDMERDELKNALVATQVIKLLVLFQNKMAIEKTGGNKVPIKIYIKLYFQFSDE